MKHPVLAVVGGVLAVLLLSGITWAGSVLLAPVFGFGDAVKKTVTGTNILDQYEHFLTLDKDIRGEAQAAQLAQQKLDAFNKQYPPSPSESFTISEQRTNLQSDVTGPQQICMTNVAEYNNEAKAYTRTAFKDNRLPDSFDPAACTDPTKLPQGLQ